MTKTLASLLAVGDQVLATKSASLPDLQTEWARLLEAAKAELGEELAGKIGGMQKGFKVGNGPALFMVQVCPFDCSSILIAFFRDESGEWSVQDPRGIGAYRVCCNYVWSKEKNKPSSQSFILVDNLPEAVALCEAQTEQFRSVKVPSND